MTPTRYKVLVRMPLLVFLGALIVMGVASRRGLLDLVRMDKQNQEVMSQLGQLRTQKSELEQKTKAVQSDRDAQERVVRSHLGLVRRSELVVEFP